MPTSPSDWRGLEATLGDASVILGLCYLTFFILLVLRTRFTGENKREGVRTFPVSRRRSLTDREWIIFLLFGRSRDQITRIVLIMLRIALAAALAVQIVSAYSISHEPRCVRMHLPCA